MYNISFRGAAKEDGNTKTTMNLVSCKRIYNRNNCWFTMLLIVHSLGSSLSVFPSPYSNLHKLYKIPTKCWSVAPLKPFVRINCLLQKWLILNRHCLEPSFCKNCADDCSSNCRSKPNHVHNNLLC